MSYVCWTDGFDEASRVEALGTEGGTAVWWFAGTLSTLATCVVCAERVVVSGFGWAVVFCATNTGVDVVIDRFVISCVMVAVTATRPAAASPIHTRLVLFACWSAPPFHRS